MLQSQLLTQFTPGLILLLLSLITYYFPPSKGNPFLLPTPSWWERDQSTWDQAYKLLSQQYALQGGLLLIICGLLLLVQQPYAPFIGYFLLPVCAGLAVWRVRKLMERDLDKN